MIHGFTLILDCPNFEDLPLDALHEALEDGSIEDSLGVVYLEFFREAPTREDAVATATRDVTAVLAAHHSPFQVVRVEPAGFDPCRYDQVEAPRQEARRHA